MTAGLRSRLDSVDTISFARGIPAPECLPVEELADCARAAVERDGRTVLSYGPVGGYGPLREWIAERHGVEAGQVLITNGSLQGFVFLASRFGGARVLVESPTYDRPLKILAGLGAQVEALPMDDDGLDPDAVEAALGRGAKPAFLYTIPTFQNPSGRTLSPERRRRIVELARAHDLLVLEDDPYGLVRYEGEPLPTLFELDAAAGDAERVVYSSSFSKTVAPGVRVGYFVLPAALEQELEQLAVSTYITPVLLAQATVYEFLRRGRFESNLERVRSALGARRDAMLEALDRDLAGAARWSRPEGGYFLWLALPEDVDAADLLSRAEDVGVTFVKGADFGGPPSSARLAFSYVSLDEIRDGISRLASLVGRPVAV
jgi:2-aminoadipate transaminase